MSLGNFSGYDVAFETYCIYLVDKPRKIMWNTFFEISLAFTLVKRALTLFVMIICVLSHSQAWKPFVEGFDKLLCALTASEWRARVLTYYGVAYAS